MNIPETVGSVELRCGVGLLNQKLLSEVLRE